MCMQEIKRTSLAVESQICETNQDDISFENHPPHSAVRRSATPCLGHSIWACCSWMTAVTVWSHHICKTDWAGGFLFQAARSLKSSSSVSASRRTSRGWLNRFLAVGWPHGVSTSSSRTRVRQNALPSYASSLSRRMGIVSIVRV